jgi:alkane 1-monooxygenase
MYLLAYVPPLWRRVMDPRVLANVDGDMSRVLTKELAIADGATR